MSTPKDIEGIRAELEQLRQELAITRALATPRHLLHGATRALHEAELAKLEREKNAVDATESAARIAEVRERNRLEEARKLEASRRTAITLRAPVVVMEAIEHLFFGPPPSPLTLGGVLHGEPTPPRPFERTDDAITMWGPIGEGWTSVISDASADLPGQPFALLWCLEGSPRKFPGITAMDNLPSSSLMGRLERMQHTARSLWSARVGGFHGTRHPIVRCQMPGALLVVHVEDLGTAHIRETLGIGPTFGELARAAKGVQVLLPVGNGHVVATVDAPAAKLSEIKGTSVGPFGNAVFEVGPAPARGGAR